MLNPGVAASTAPRLGVAVVAGAASAPGMAGMATVAAVAGVAGAVCAEARPVQPQTAAVQTASNIVGLVMILPYGFGKHGGGNGGALLDQTSRVNFWQSVTLTCAVKYPVKWLEWTTVT